MDYHANETAAIVVDFVLSSSLPDFAQFGYDRGGKLGSVEDTHGGLFRVRGGNNLRISHWQNLFGFDQD